MALRRVAADDHHQVGLFYVRDRTGIAAVADRSEQTGGCRSLAVSRAVVHVVCADHGSRQFLHQVAFFVGAFGRGDKGESVGPSFALISARRVATRSSASSQPASRKRSPSRISGVVSRSWLLTKSHANFSF